MFPKSNNEDTLVEYIMAKQLFESAGDPAKNTKSDLKKKVGGSSDEQSDFDPLVVIRSHLSTELDENKL